MSDNVGFHIYWQVDDESWAQARQLVDQFPVTSDYARSGQAYYYMLEGTLQLRYADASLFPPSRLKDIERRARSNLTAHGSQWYPIPDDYGRNGIWISLLDYANQLIRIVKVLAAVGTDQDASGRFRENGGGRIIDFARSDSAITIESSVLPDLRLTVPVEEFMTEARRFLLDFIGAIDQRLPVLLQWESLERLRKYYHNERDRVDK